MANVGLVIGDTGVPTAGDLAIQDELDNNHVVTVVADTDAVPAGQDAFCISESCTPTDLGAKYAAPTVPCLCLEVGYWDDMQMVNTSNVNTGTQTEAVLFSYPPITTGVSIPLSNAGGLFGLPNAGVCSGGSIFMKSNNVSFPQTHALGWAIEQGANLWVGKALRRMIGLSIINNAAGNMTASGRLIITNSMVWLLSPPVIPFASGGISGLRRRRLARRSRNW